MCFVRSDMKRPYKVEAKYMMCVRYSYIYNKYSWTDCIEWMEEDRYWMVAVRYRPTGRGNLGRPSEKR